MTPRPPRSPRTDTRRPHTTLFRSPVRGRGLGHHRCAGLVGVCFERREEFGGAAAAEEMREIEVDGLGAAADPAFEVGALVAGQRRSHVRRRGRIVEPEEHTSELQSLIRISYAVFCLKKKKN